VLRLRFLEGDPLLVADRRAVRGPVEADELTAAPVDDAGEVLAVGDRPGQRDRLQPDLLGDLVQQLQRRACPAGRTC
jgi:hypothetical protein